MGLGTLRKIILGKLKLYENDCTVLSFLPIISSVSYFLESGFYLKRPAAKLDQIFEFCANSLFDIKFAVLKKYFCQ